MITAKKFTMIRSLLMLIALVAMACLTACVSTNSAIPLTEPSYDRSHASDRQKFIVAIRPLVEPVGINQIHSWEIRVTTSSGAPVTKAVLFVGGGMPDHGHGFPTRPAVTREVEPGTYLLEGMKFSMHGRWEIKLAIQVGEDSDMVTFNTMILLPAALPTTGK